MRGIADDSEIARSDAKLFCNLFVEFRDLEEVSGPAEEDFVAADVGGGMEPPVLDAELHVHQCRRVTVDGA